MLVISQNAFEKFGSLAERNRLIINYFLAKIPIELQPAVKAEIFCKKFFNFEQYVMYWQDGF
jgi:hypothetical protein